MVYGLDIRPEAEKLGRKAEADCREQFALIDENCLQCSARILNAFQEEKVSTADFLEVTGYGYDDPGREKLDRIYARVMGTEDALVRIQLMSGTHALAMALGGLLKHGDTLLSVSGRPYDTLCGVIGLQGGSRNSLIANGIRYEEIELADNDFDYPAIAGRLSRRDVRLVEIQRSRGYADRKSLTIDKIERAIRCIREAAPETVILVDNCYGEFTEEREPGHVGADVLVGSMMKNPGGGIAVSGAYCAGKEEYIRDIAERMTAPLIGKNLGANLNQLTSLYKGLFLAPRAVSASLKTMTFAARLLELAGFEGIDPRYDEKRTDIVQTIRLGSAENLKNFCIGLQHGSPIESYVTPVPGPMPGYSAEEIMGGGTFTTGSTIELSADGPMLPPYTVYMQGGLSYEYGKLGILMALSRMMQ
jgi:cystathionine beta-lyase family protein involved in aluminum resistance